MSNHQSKEIAVFPAFYPPHIGGMEFFAHELNLRLSKNHQKITVFAPNFSKAPIIFPDEMNLGVTLIDYPAFEIIHNFPCPKFWQIAFWSALGKLSRQPCDVAISHTRFFIISFIAFWFARFKRIPLIHIEHGSSAVQSKNTLITVLSSLYDSTIGRSVVRGADVVIAISDDVNRFLRNKWGVRSTTIMRGFDPEMISAIPMSQEYPRSANTVRIMYIGRLISGKGIDILVKSLIDLPEKNWELFIVGDGPDRSLLQERSKQLIPNSVVFTGKKEPREAIALLKTADIFVNPSLSEGLPTSVAEAALCGKAIIATDVGGTRKLFPRENISYLVPPNNPDAIRERISILLGTPSLLKKTGSINKEHIIMNFSWNRPIQEFLRVLETLPPK